MNATASIVRSVLTPLGLLCIAPGWAIAADLMVVSVQPAARSLTAPTNAAIVVEFDKPVRPKSIVALRSFWAFGRWSGTAVGTFSFSNGDRIVSLTPDHDFSAGESVMVILSHDIEATDGSTLRPSGYSYQFWTRAAPATMDFSLIDTLTTRTTPAESSRAYGGIASDLNGDRFLDITIVNEDTADLRVFLNLADRSGMVAPFLQPTFPVNDRASPSEPTDFDRDGNVDLCVANINTNSVSILLGQGNGTFAPQQQIGVGSQPRGIAVLDADGDGDIDIVNTNSASNNMSLLLNDGSGGFGGPSIFEGGGNGEWALSAADMNQDGILDLVIGARTGQRVLVDLGTGAAGFTFFSSQLSDGNVWMLSTGDLDGNGTEDVVVGNSAANRGAVLLGNGAGLLGLPQGYLTDPFTIATDLGDLDGDGDLDWVTSSYGGDWRVFTNDGDGTFTLSGEFASTTAASCALMLDLDNDADLDLALIDEEADEIILMKNSGTGLVPAVSRWGVVVIAGLLLVCGVRRIRQRTAATTDWCLDTSKSASSGPRGSDREADGGALGPLSRFGAATEAMAHPPSRVAGDVIRTPTIL